MFHTWKFSTQRNGAEAVAPHGAAFRGHSAAESRFPPWCTCLRGPTQPWAVPLTQNSPQAETLLCEQLCLFFLARSPPPGRLQKAGLFINSEHDLPSPKPPMSA